MEDWEVKLIREIELKNLAPSTKKAYLARIYRLIKFYDKHPKDITFEEIKVFLHHFKNEKPLGRKAQKRSPNTVNGAASAILFFYHKVFGRNYSGEMPRMKSAKHQPIVLSRGEVKRMIEGLENLLWKAIVMIIYSTGMRQSEARNLKIQDIDSKRMVIYIRNSKGAKDRQAKLYPNVLECLRIYWQKYRIEKNSHVKSDYLFIPNKNSYNGNLSKSLSHTAVGYIVSKAAKIAGIKKKFILTA